MANLKGKEMTQTDVVPTSVGAERFGMFVQNVSGRLNRIVEVTCALLVGLMVLVVWLGIVDRYFVGANITWTEEFARYVMIWAALLAMSCGARKREHIGFNLLVDKLPERLRQLLVIVVDLISVLFFVYLVVYGLRMTIDGTHQYATIFGMTMMVPFAAVPVSAFLTVIQILSTSPLLIQFPKYMPVGNNK
jgi:TRAP-type C4-dicarboxylate transport system permease small subunit